MWLGEYTTAGREKAEKLQLQNLLVSAIPVASIVFSQTSFLFIYYH